MTVCRGLWVFLLFLAGLALHAAGQPVAAQTAEATDKNSGEAAGEVATDEQDPADKAEAAAVEKNSDDKNTDDKDAKPGEKQAAKEADQESVFIRVKRNDAGTAIAMETAIASYRGKNTNGQEVQVDLIGVVHVGERTYYKQLNRLFEDYDVLLYELVAPEGTKVTPNRPRGGHPISLLQKGLQNLLKLDFQLDSIDYSKPNFVHADMTPAEFAKSMKDRGESFFQIFLRAFRKSMQAQALGGNDQAPSDAELLVALFAKDRALRMKRIMAEQFENLEGQMDMFNGPDGSTLITERNKKALAVLREQIQGGKTRIGVFYGAGHMPDMESRLLGEFGMKKADESWLKAWTMNDPQGAKAPHDQADPEKAAPGDANGKAPPSDDSANGSGK